MCPVGMAHPLKKFNLNADTADAEAVGIDSCLYQTGHAVSLGQGSVERHATRVRQHGRITAPISTLCSLSNSRIVSLMAKPPHVVKTQRAPPLAARSSRLTCFGTKCLEVLWYCGSAALIFLPRHKTAIHSPALPHSRRRQPAQWAGHAAALLRRG